MRDKVAICSLVDSESACFFAGDFLGEVERPLLAPGLFFEGVGLRELPLSDDEKDLDLDREPLPVE